MSKELPWVVNQEPYSYDFGKRRYELPPRRVPSSAADDQYAAIEDIADSMRRLELLVAELIEKPTPSFPSSIEVTSRNDGSAGW